MPIDPVVSLTLTGELPVLARRVCCLRGRKPGDLPIEQPTRVALAINRRTATRLHLTIPPALLLQAETVID